MQIFELQADIGGDHVLNAGARHPTVEGLVGAVRDETGIGGLLAGFAIKPDPAALTVEQGSPHGDAQATRDVTVEATVECDVLVGRRVRAGDAACTAQVHPAEIALDADDQLTSLPIVASAAAAEGAVDIVAEWANRHAARGLALIDATPGIAGVGAEVKAGP